MIADSPADGAVGPAHGAVDPADGAVGPADRAVGPAHGAVGPAHGAVGPAHGAAAPADGLAGAGRALELAYRFLGKRERTEMEVRSRLERAHFKLDEVEAAVGELKEFGYINDARYARLFTEDRRSLDAWGSSRIARVLRERGVARELIDAALEAVPAADGSDGSADEGGGVAQPTGDQSWQRSSLDDLGRAIALLDYRFPNGPGSERDHNRAFGMLARKGYESEIAADAVRAWGRSRSE